MTSDQFDFWCRRNGVAGDGKAYLELVRSSPPSRRVASGRGNVPCRYPSEKMKLVIQAESHTVELPVLHLLEHDPDVLEFYDQPEGIRLRYKTIDGRSATAQHTPDFLVIRNGSAGWIECKQEEELRKLAKTHPNRYHRELDGVWRCPPAEAIAEERGLTYEIYSSDKIDWILQRNFNFLDDYLRYDREQVPEEIVEQVRQAVEASPGILLGDLRRKLADVSADAIHFLIARGQIYVDFSAAPLAETDRVAVFRDEATAQGYALSEKTRLAPRTDIEPPAILLPGATIEFDGRSMKILHRGDTIATLQDENGRLVEWPNEEFDGLLKSGRLTGDCSAAAFDMQQQINIQSQLGNASREDFDEANARYDAIRPYLNTGIPKHQFTPPGTPSVRSRRRWIGRYEAAEQEYGCGYIGLLPDENLGNRLPKMPERTRAKMVEFIDQEFESIRNEGVIQSWRRYMGICDAESPPLDPPSRATFSRAIRQRPRWQQILKRQGKRAAYAHEPFYWRVTQTTPRHGDRPFEICHLDHTQLDVQCVCAETGKDLGRPWLTLLIDAFSRRILAVFLTFDPPSYRSCMAALRICVKRWGRLPQKLVVDGGKEFLSTYFETLLGVYRIEKKQRPGAKARFGCVCERMFDTANQQLIHSLLGNTKLMTKVRQVTKSVDPKNHAVWTLGELYVALCEYCHEIYDTIEHSTLLQTPRALFAAGLERGGGRSHLFIPYSEAFKLTTLPTTKKGTARVRPNAGISVNYIVYWCDEFRRPEIEGTNVPVRYDPFDLSRAYAYVRNKWTLCVPPNRFGLQDLSEKELMLITQEIRQRQRQQSNRAAFITGRIISDYLGRTAVTETRLQQQKRDAAVRGIFSIIEGGKPDTLIDATTAQPSVVAGAGTVPESGKTSVWDQEIDPETLETFGGF
jgi:putative transposase